jgi:hypothetical protein
MPQRMTIDQLTLGAQFEDLLVEVFSLDGVDTVSKAKDPVYRATVRDSTGFVTLVYRSSNNCSPSNIKKGKYYYVTGAVGALGT